MLTKSVIQRKKSLEVGGVHSPSAYLERDMWGEDATKDCASDEESTVSFDPEELAAQEDSDCEYDATESEPDEEEEQYCLSSTHTDDTVIGLSVSERAMAHLKASAEKELRRMRQTIQALRDENSSLKTELSDRCAQHETQRATWKRAAVELKRQVIEATTLLTSTAAEHADVVLQHAPASRAAMFPSPSRDDALLTPDAACARISSATEKRDVSAVLRVMTAHAGEEGVQLAASRAILKLLPCVEASEYRAVAEHGGPAWQSLQREYRQLHRAGVMEGMMGAAAAHRGSAELQEAMCKVVLCMSRPAVELEAEGGEGDKVAEVTAAMAAHPAAEEVQEAACGALRNLAVAPENQARMLNLNRDVARNTSASGSEPELPGALDLLLGAMREHRASARVQEHGCGCLRNLAEEGGGVGGLAERAVTKALLSAMAEHAWDSKVQAEGCGALRHLAFTLQGRGQMVGAGAVQRVVGAMEQHPWTEEVQLEALGALRILALEAGAVIGEEGGLNAVLLAMAEHAASAGVQEEGCGALRNLAAGDGAMRQQIAAAQGVGAVLVAMKGHAWHAAVQEEGAAALRNLAIDQDGLRRIARRGGAAVLGSALRGHAGHAGVQEHAGAVLEALSRRGAERLGSGAAAACGEAKGVGGQRRQVLG